jgi:PhnB protein
MMRLANFLFFTTRCEEALAFYSRCGLGRIIELKRYGADGVPVGDEAFRGKIAYARFAGPDIEFYASDNHDAEPMRGSAHYLTTDDREETDRIFGCLGEGGTVTTQLAVQPWGGYYGKLTDRFGVQWMIECRSIG